MNLSCFFFSVSLFIVCGMFILTLLVSLQSLNTTESLNALQISCFNIKGFMKWSVLLGVSDHPVNSVRWRFVPLRGRRWPYFHCAGRGSIPMRQWQGSGWQRVQRNVASDKVWILLTSGLDSVEHVCTCTYILSISELFLLPKIWPFISIPGPPGPRILLHLSDKIGWASNKN